MQLNIYAISNIDTVKSVIPEKQMKAQYTANFKKGGSQIWKKRF